MKYFIRVLIVNIIFFCYIYKLNAEIFDIKSAVNEIVSAPSWESMNAEDMNTKGILLILSLEKFTKLGPDETRSLLKALSLSAKNNQDAGIDGKIYIFNRLYCKVPIQITRNGWRFFGGWVTNSGPLDPVDSLYPLTQSGTGALKLTRVFGGYAGPDYRGLQEFDFLLTRFGRRHE